MPWARWDDGEPLGWDTSWRLWKSFLLPYRTAEVLNVGTSTGELELGPWQWNAPDIVRRLRRVHG